MVSTGYRGPRVSRGLHPSGYREALVFTVGELGEIDPKTHAVRIGHTVGGRNRVKIITEARRRKFLILNARQVKEAAGEKEKPEEELAEEETKEKTEMAEEKPAAEKEEEPKKPAKRARRVKKEKETGEEQ